MNIRTGLGYLGALVFAVVSLGALAQTAASGPGANDAPPVASAAPAKSQRAANRALRRRVYATVVKHQEIDAGNISVVARGGAVTLDGTVSDASQISKVEDIVRGVPGVASVTNRLAVRKSFNGE
ncbi:BON domain-containing protein [Paraburkholderia acidiphila]|uniref:BON domain-containing protein n=1 Tax=Paraburkholderia acidiphila TaxID=2571747 RepID=A0A7Z2G9S6_9BURK|nr:BON domain-containing protein [Paraburkholderia acidiphila]QGZ57722.1 BON domain-containing protein [Paraburkholderia acidiphila]